MTMTRRMVPRSAKLSQPAPPHQSMKAGRQGWMPFATWTAPRYRISQSSLCISHGVGVHLCCLLHRLGWALRHTWTVSCRLRALAAVDLYVGARNVRCNRTAEVRGSIPLSSTSLFPRETMHREDAGLHLRCQSGETALRRVDVSRVPQRTDEHYSACFNPRLMGAAHRPARLATVSSLRLVHAFLPSVTTLLSGSAKAFGTSAVISPMMSSIAATAPPR
jgi:hypothetical protein